MFNNNGQRSPTVTDRNDPRRRALEQWLAGQFADRDWQLQPASNDASFRRYFRIRHGGNSYIAMDAPPEQEDCGPYLTVSALLCEHGLNAPRVLHRDLGRGFLLLDDLGDTQYLTVLNDTTVDRLYNDALDALYRMQAAVPTAELPIYDRTLLHDEMWLFLDWFLQQHLQLDVDADALSIINAAFEQLIAGALEQPRVFVHRDYHSRNLMVCEQNNPGILDFQDAVSGPVTYDLVSLLRDCYIAWPEARVREWTERHYERLHKNGKVDVDRATFGRWFDWMGVQRHLKAIGIFARLNHRDGKPAYLADIPRTFDYVLQVCELYRELHEFGELMRRLRITERLGR